MDPKAETPANIERLTAQLNEWGIDLKKLRAARGDRAGAETRVAPVTTNRFTGKDHV